MDKVRYGIVGLGEMGRKHADLIAQNVIEGAVLAAATTSRPSSAEALKSRTPGLAVYDDHDSMMTSGLIDAVIICTPHYSHPEISINAFEHGLHVLCEKPLGAYTSQVRALGECAAKSGKKFGVMYNQRAHPLYQKLREIIAKGELGEIYRTSWILTNSYRPQAYYDDTWRGTWAQDGGGVLINSYVHQVDIWQWVLGMVPDRLRAICRYGKLRDIEVENEAVIYADFPGGVTGSFIAAGYEAPGTNRLEISGDNGHIVVEEGHLTFNKLSMSAREFSTVGKGSEKPGSKAVIFEAKPSESQHAVIIQNFTDAIRYDSPLIAPGEDGIKALEIVNAAYLSDWLDRWVELPLDDELYHEQLQNRGKKV